MTTTYEAPRAPEAHETLDAAAARFLIMGETEYARELSCSDNSYGGMFERYGELLFGEGCLDKLDEFAKAAVEIVKGEQKDNPVLQLAALTTCLDLSQAAMSVAGGYDTRYPSTQLSTRNLPAAIDSIRHIVDATVPDTALVEIVKEKIDWIFEAYRDQPELEVDVPMRDYETEVLGPVILLKRENDAGIEALLDLSGPNQPIGPIQGQPTLFAKGMIGFRDLVDHISVATTIDQEDVEARARYSFKQYNMMPFDRQIYLAGPEDYEQVLDTQRRKLVVDNARPLEEIVHSDKKAVALFQEMHRPIVRAIVEKSMGLSLKDVTLDNQSAFLQFCLRRSRSEYERLSKVMIATPEENRIQLFEAFLATEFGDDLGDVIINLAEKEPDKSMEVFEQLQGLRKSGDVIAKHFGKEKGIDGRVATAFIKRATELVALAEKEGIDAIAEELAKVHDAVGQIADAVDNAEFEVVAIGQEADYGTLQAKGDHKVTVTARPYGEQARIGFTVRYPKGQRINVRLDYDNGRISLDIAQTSQHANASDISRQIGEKLARGELAINTRRAEQAIREGRSRQDITLHGNHVREAFESMGDVMPEEFAGIVNTFLYSLKMAEDSTGLQTAA